MLTFSESAASEWAAAGVRVNTVAPGAIASSGLDTYDAEHRAYIQNEIACEIPLQRFGTEAEVAAAIVFLLSPAAAFITGSCIRIDGGAPNARRVWGKLAASDKSKPFNGFHRANAPEISRHRVDQFQIMPLGASRGNAMAEKVAYEKKGEVAYITL